MAQVEQELRIFVAQPPTTVPTVAPPPSSELVLAPVLLSHPPVIPRAGMWGRSLIAGFIPCTSVNGSGTWMSDYPRDVTLMRLEVSVGFFPVEARGGDFGVSIYKAPVVDPVQGVLGYLETAPRDSDAVTMRVFDYSPSGVLITPQEGVTAGFVCDNHGNQAQVQLLIIGWFQ